MQQHSNLVNMRCPFSVNLIDLDMIPLQTNLTILLHKYPLKIPGYFKFDIFHESIIENLQYIVNHNV